MEIREIYKSDLEQLLTLYMQLHDNPMPVIDHTVVELWNRILHDENHHIIVGIEKNKVVCSCVLMIVLNLTRNQRPYALIENVITDKSCRNKGYASKVLSYARDIAGLNRCYKIMLMTGSKKESTLEFYRKNGYNSDDKTAFIQWL